MHWWDSFCNKPPTRSMRLTSPSPGRCARAGKPLPCKGFLAASRCNGITITTRARRRAIIRRTPRWVWRSVTRRPWPSSFVWKGRAGFGGRLPAGPGQAHLSGRAALGLEVGYTPALAKLICLEGADEPTYLKAERPLEKTGGITVSARQIQRVVQRVGGSAQAWQERPAQPSPCDAPILYVSADGTGLPMVPEELKGRRGQQADGTAKTRQVYLGCVFTQHHTDEEGYPVRDYESTPYVSSFKPIDDFGPLLRQEAIRRGLGSAGQVVVLIDGARGLENMGKDCFKDCLQIVDFYHAMEHAGQGLEALIGKIIPTTKSGGGVGPSDCSRTKPRT